MNDADLHWLAGLLEGEGSFLKGPPSAPRSPILTVSMTDEDVMQRVAGLLGSACVSHKARRENWKPAYATRLTGKKAVALMQRLRPLMGSRRQGQIDKAMATYALQPRKINHQQGEEILRRLTAGERAEDLANEFGVTKWSVYAIKQGRFFSLLS